MHAKTEKKGGKSENMGDHEDVVKSTSDQGKRSDNHERQACDAGKSPDDVRLFRFGDEYSRLPPFIACG